MSKQKLDMIEEKNQLQKQKNKVYINKFWDSEACQRLAINYLRKFKVRLDIKNDESIAVRFNYSFKDFVEDIMYYDLKGEPMDLQNPGLILSKMAAYYSKVIVCFRKGIPLGRDIYLEFHRFSQKPKHVTVIFVKDILGSEKSFLGERYRVKNSVYKSLLINRRREMREDGVYWKSGKNNLRSK